MRGFTTTVYSRSDGFALPTILIASTIMMIALVAAATAATSMSMALTSQYYHKLAQEAAESGAVYAAQCLKDNDDDPLWNDAGRTLQPNTDCSGNVVSGVDQYIVNTSLLRTSFVVDQTTVVSGVVQYHVTGTVQLLRTSDGAVWNSYSRGLQADVRHQLTTATSIASGIVEVCGVIGQKTWCWGYNMYGQLGDGTTNDTTIPVKVARLAGGLDGKLDKLVAASEYSTCIVTTDNLVYCMGRNNVGQLGNGTTTEAHVPTPVDTTTGLAGKTITSIVAVGQSMCVIASGDVYCWGNGLHGDIGNGSSANQSKPTRVSTIGTTNGNPVTYLSGSVYGEFHCAVASGKVYCWGRNDLGQLGDGTTTDRYSPVAVTTSGGIGSRTAVEVASAGTGPWNSSKPASDPDGASSYNAYAVMSDGTLWAWGANNYGQLGQGTYSVTPQLTPIQVGGALLGKSTTHVSSGFSTPCALTSDNTLYCWGQNYLGQVGDGTTTTRYTPTPVAMQTPGMAGKTISLILGGGFRNCAIASSISYCWGNNGGGQIGDGTTTNRYVPTEATFLLQYVPAMYY